MGGGTGGGAGGGRKGTGGGAGGGREGDGRGGDGRGDIPRERRCACWGGVGGGWGTATSARPRCIWPAMPALCARGGRGAPQHSGRAAEAWLERGGMRNAVSRRDGVSGSPNVSDDCCGQDDGKDDEGAMGWGVQTSQNCGEVALEDPSPQSGTVSDPWHGQDNENPAVEALTVARAAESSFRCKSLFRLGCEQGKHSRFPICRG